MAMPTSLVNRPDRAAATAGALLAASTATAMALAAGTAAADEPGRCVTDVNVHAEPVISAPVVGRCAAGTAVQVGEEQDGFVHLAELGGWAAGQYVTVDGAAPAPAPTAAPAGHPPAPPAGDQATGPATGPATDADRAADGADGVDRTPADGDDATGIGARTTRGRVDDGATHAETTWTDQD
jgi:hypothetical protein